MRASWQTRALEPADRAAWDDLWRSYLDFYEVTLTPRVTEATFARLTSGALGFAGLVAVREDGRPAGFAHLLFHPSTWSATSYCYLEDLFVAASARGSGAGRTLLEAAYAEADLRRCDRVYWSTEKDNRRARGLYDQVAVVTPYVVYRR